MRAGADNMRRATEACELALIEDCDRDLDSDSVVDEVRIASPSSMRVRQGVKISLFLTALACLAIGIRCQANRWKRRSPLDGASGVLRLTAYSSSESPGVHALASEAAAVDRAGEGASHAASAINEIVDRAHDAEKGLREKKREAEALAEYLAAQALELAEEAKKNLTAAGILNKTAVLQQSTAMDMMHQADIAAKNGQDTLKASGGSDSVSGFVQDQLDAATDTKEKAASMLDKAKSLKDEADLAVENAQGSLLASKELQKVSDNKKKAVQTVGSWADTIDSLGANLSLYVQKFQADAQSNDAKADKLSLGAKARQAAITKAADDIEDAKAATKAAQVKIVHARGVLKAAELSNASAQKASIAAQEVAKQLLVQNSSLHKALATTEKTPIPAQTNDPAAGKVLHAATSIVGMARKQLSTIDTVSSELASEISGAKVLAKKVVAVKAQAGQDMAAASKEKESAGERWNTAIASKRSIDSKAQQDTAVKGEVHAMQEIATQDKAVLDAAKVELQAQDSVVKVLSQESQAELAEAAALQKQASSAPSAAAGIFMSAAERATQVGAKMQTQADSYRNANVDISSLQSTAQTSAQAAAASQREAR